MSAKSSAPITQVATLVDLLGLRRESEPNRLCYRFLPDANSDGAVSLTYGELDARARAIAGWLQSMDARGQRALLFYPSGLDYIAAFFGCLYAGVAAVPLYPPGFNRKLFRLQAIAEDAQASIALTTESILPELKSSLTAPALQKLRWQTTDNIPRAWEEEWRYRRVSRDDIAFLQYTSGSTGRLKGVVVTHGNILHNSSLIAAGFEYSTQTQCVTWLPLYHDMGLIGGILQPLYGNFPNTLLSPTSFARNPYKWLKTISETGANLSGGPNFAYELCLQRISVEQRATLDLRNWTVAFVGAEPIRADTLDRFAEGFASCGFRREAFLPCYGLAEATLIVSCGSKSAAPSLDKVSRKALEQHQVTTASVEEDQPRTVVGCGRPCGDQQIRIVDSESLTECGANEIGEIWVSGPSVGKGYWNRPVDTEETFHAYLPSTGEGPFLRTRDLGYLRNGELFITGRSDDLIIIRGRNHYPQDIELTVSQSHELLRSNRGAVFSVSVLDQEQLVVVHELSRGSTSE